MRIIRKILTSLLAGTLLAGCAQKNIEVQVPNEEAVANYATTLFDTTFVHEINVELPPESFRSLLNNPEEKEKFHADVTIDGETIQDVAFSTKGNTSLRYVASEEGNNRYSFKINFGKYVKGQTYHGLDKLHLNNSFIDPTFSKDYLSYYIFRSVHVDAPLTTFVNLTINDEPFGLYTAIENVGESFLNRTGKAPGRLYKPEESRFQEESDTGGADLVYIDDNPETYPEIFDEAETDYTESDARNLLLALKNMNQETNLEQFLNTDEIIRYFAAHIFLVDNDGYTEKMFHNYFLYEKDGKLEMLPWDYNSAFAGYGDEISAREGVMDYERFENFDVHEPIQNDNDYGDRPMFRWIINNSEYTEQYHRVFKEMIDENFDTGEFVNEANRIREMIRPYVKETKNAFYPVEEFDEAFDEMLEFADKRAESVKKQIL